MGVALAFKRLGRVYHPSPRRFIRANISQLSLLAVGISFGMYSECLHKFGPEQLVYVTTAAFFALIVLRWWAGNANR
jgi:hypothetical protein